MQEMLRDKSIGASDVTQAHIDMRARKSRTPPALRRPAAAGAEAFVPGKSYSSSGPAGAAASATSIDAREAVAGFSPAGAGGSSSSAGAVPATIAMRATAKIDSEWQRVNAMLLKARRHHELWLANDPAWRLEKAMKGCGAWNPRPGTHPANWIQDKNDPTEECTVYINQSRQQYDELNKHYWEVYRSGGMSEAEKEVILAWAHQLGAGTERQVGVESMGRVRR